MSSSHPGLHRKSLPPTTKNSNDKSEPIFKSPGKNKMSRCGLVLRLSRRQLSMAGRKGKNL